METEYKSNSHKSKAITSETTTTQVKTVPEKKVTKAIVKGTVKKKNKIINAFVSEDTQNIKNYIVMEVLIPAIKDVVIECNVKEEKAYIRPLRGLFDED